MADGKPPVLPAPHPPLVVPPAPHVQWPVPPAYPIVPPSQPIQPAPMPQLNSLHFKPEFPGKPNGDVEAHLLRTTIGWAHMLSQKVSKYSIFVSH